MMKKAVRDKWCAALRGELPKKYEQGQGALRDGDRFCCLGVLHDVADGRWEPSRTDFDRFATPSGSIGYLDGDESQGLSRDHAVLLADRNDGANGVGRAYSFPEQADWIEANVPCEPEDGVADG